jgi:hypothetical protein
VQSSNATPTAQQEIGRKRAAWRNDAQHEADHHNFDATDRVGQPAYENNEDAGEERGDSDGNIHQAGAQPEILLHVWRDV